MTKSDVRVEDKDGVRWIILSRPETRNAVLPSHVLDMGKACNEAQLDESIRSIVVYGEGGAFCSGLDLKAFQETNLDIKDALEEFHAGIRNLREVLKPTIAAIDGPAAGFGADLALACDLRLVSANASWGERFVGIGLMPDGGGTFMLPKLVGVGKALELIYEGRMVKAEEGVALGLFNRAILEGDFCEQVQTYAHRIAQGPPLAYAAAKRAIIKQLGDYAAALDLEGTSQLELVKTNDFMEGVSAFLQKRPPQFQGR